MNEFPTSFFPVNYDPTNIFLPSIDESMIPKGLTPEPANVKDVHAVSVLINEYAIDGVMLARGPQYLYQNLQEYYVVKVPSPQKLIGPLGESDDLVIACVSLHILWEDLAEVRSLAVHPQLKRMGYGRVLVDFLKKEAKSIGINRLFAFTLRPDFFAAMGFHEVAREKLPPVVWNACSNCPKFYKCDEIGMMMHI